MGVRFSHGNASWSYTGFGHFRERVAKIEGIHLSDMRGFGGSRSWDDTPSALEPLLNHSDCDGELSPAQCEQMLPRLREVQSRLTRDGERYDAEHLADLIEGMEMCVRDREALEFR